jgi:predicted PurR-regulated permease PerM
MQFTTTQKTSAAWIGIALFFFGLIWLLGPVLTPFVVAAVFAYVLTPLVDKFKQASRLPRLLAVILVEILFILALVSVVLLVAPIFAKELPLMKEQLPLLAQRINGSLAPWLAQFGMEVSLDVSAIKAFALKYLSANLEDATGSIVASLKIGGSVALAFVGNLILIPVALFFFLKDWELLMGRINQLIPPKMRPAFDDFLEESDTLLGQYLRGQLLVMLVLAIYFSLALKLFGFELALPIGVFTGLAFFIPYLGFGLGLILALLAGLLQFSASYGLLAVAIVYGFGQLFESLFLTPRMVGERIGLHPLAVIFALLAFGQLFGFVGVLVALPASAVMLVAIRRIRSSYFASTLYQG